MASSYINPFEHSAVFHIETGEYVIACVDGVSVKATVKKIY